MDILPCGCDHDACSICLTKENTLHSLYDCQHMKDI